MGGVWGLPRHGEPLPSSSSSLIRPQMEAAPRDIQPPLPMPPGLSHGLVSARSGPVPICWKRVSHRQKDPSGCPHCPSLLMGSWVILPPLRGNRHRILRQVRPQLAESGEVSCGSNCLILQKGKPSPEKLRDLPEDTQQWGDGQWTRSLFLSLNPSSRHRPQVHIPEGHLHHGQGQGYLRG